MAYGIQNLVIFLSIEHGGGLELDESLEECCVREILEETGYVVKPLEKFLVMNEYYEEYKALCEYLKGK